MCSYQRINNSYGCQNSKTLNGVLKGELGFQVIYHLIFHFALCSLTKNRALSFRTGLRNTVVLMRPWLGWT